MTAIASIFRNHLYYGGVFIKGYKDEEETVVDGIHEPIITKKLFLKVQDILNNRCKKYHTAHKKINEKFPLKEFLTCPVCSTPLTASSSKGRSKHYTYYHCISPCNERYRLEDVNLWFADFLQSITIEKPFQKILVEMIKNQLVKQSGKVELGPKHYEKVKNIEDKLVRLQDLCIEGNIEKSVYKIAKDRYDTIRQELKSNEVELKDKKRVIEIYESALTKLESIRYQYNVSDIEGKRRIIGSIFPKKFQFENKKVRTADFNPLF